jgi:UDP-N-acetylmuramate: L-alanyl-gamma-D-glutamyl-meso-diaminopimelate ligase
MRVHFIAIGGSVMHQLAIALSKKGYEVTGSDDEIFEPALSNLQNQGILPATQGWFPDKIQSSIDAIILGMHARADNEELRRAQELNLRIYSFPEYIYQESINKTRVVVGGSHGKTTTTAMIMHVLRSLDRPFDYLVGARLEGFTQSVQISDAPVIVCEGDEYPASTLERRPKFHFLHPGIAILTGIAWDHINVFPTFENYLEQFSIFIGMIQQGGALIYNETDPVLKDLVKKTNPSVRLVPYGVPDSSIVAGQTSVTIEGVTTALKVFGNHNLLNLHAAYLACRELGVSANAFASGIASFKGASRRMELLYANKGLNVYRDFAHAPSKVIATIQALSRQFPDRRLVTVLELHTFSSLSENFLGEYAGSLDAAQSAAVFYSLHALQLKRLPDLPAAKVKEAFGREDLQVITSRDELLRWLSAQDFQHTNLLFMSSGNYDGLDLTRAEEYLPKNAL